MSARRRDARAEVVRLAQLLGHDPAALDGLTAADPADLRALRRQVTDLLFDADRPQLQRIVAAADRLPVQLVAQIGPRAFGPLLCARVTGLLAPERAVAIAERLDAPFLAELATELDPRRARAVLAAVPVRLALTIAAELTAREDAVTMARYVGELNDATLVAALGVVDDATLLRVAVLLGEDAGLDHLVGLLPDDRLRGLLHAATEHGLWADALDLLGHLGPAQRAHAARVTAGLDDTDLAALVGAAATDDLWGAVVPLLPLLDEETRARFAALPAVHDPAVLGGLAAAAREAGVAEDVAALVPLLPAAARDAAQAALAGA